MERRERERTVLDGTADLTMVASGCSRFPLMHSLMSAGI